MTNSGFVCFSFQVTCTKDGREIHHGGRYEVVTSVGICSLEISSCDVGDAGRYTCVAVNKLGRDETSCKITVNGSIGFKS